MIKQDLTWFQNLSASEVAVLAHQRGLRTVVFAAGGTTRWYILNHLSGWPKDWSYWLECLSQGANQFLRIARLFFDHGIDTLLTHALTPGQFDSSKGKQYLALALTAGMDEIAGSPEFLRFYDEYGVRVRFFGNHRQVLEGTQYERALALFSEIEARTSAHKQHRLFWGFNSIAVAEDQTAPILELAAQYYRDHGRPPTRREAIEQVYGEPVELVDIFISFNRPTTADLMPPLLDGRADLYFTVGLSFDFAQPQLRSILYDHLYERPGRHRDYSELPSSSFSELREFYRLNVEGVIGVGRRYGPGAVWHPMPQVRLPIG